MKRIFTEEHRRKISESRKRLKDNGWTPYNVGLKTADRKNGRVTFALTEIQANNLGKYYYEIQAIDALGGKRTYEIPIDSATLQPGNVFVFVQDINKE